MFLCKTWKINRYDLVVREKKGEEKGIRRGREKKFKGKEKKKLKKEENAVNSTALNLVTS